MWPDLPVLLKCFRCSFTGPHLTTDLIVCRLAKKDRPVRQWQSRSVMGPWFLNVYFFYHVTLATCPAAVVVSNHLILYWQPQSLSILNCTHVHNNTHRHTHTGFDKVLVWSGLEGTGYWWAQGYGVWLSGKYPTHTLNKDDGGRETADPQEQILTERRFACSALFLFQTCFGCGGLWLFQVIFTDAVLSCMCLLANWCLLPNTAAGVRWRLKGALWKTT